MQTERGFKIIEASEEEIRSPAEIYVGMKQCKRSTWGVNLWAVLRFRNTLYKLEQSTHFISELAAPQSIGKATKHAVGVLSTAELGLQ